jgi:hypothetical protein
MTSKGLIDDDSQVCRAKARSSVGSRSASFFAGTATMGRPKDLFESIQSHVCQCSNNTASKPRPSLESSKCSSLAQILITPGWQKHPMAHIQGFCVTTQQQHHVGILSEIILKSRQRRPGSKPCRRGGSDGLSSGAARSGSRDACRARNSQTRSSRGEITARQQRPESDVAYAPDNRRTGGTLPQPIPTGEPSPSRP